jgi:hypothetical protein
MATTTDTVTTTWSGTGNGVQLNGVAQVTGSTNEGITGTLTAGAVGQPQPFPMSHSALQEFLALCDQNVTMSVNAQMFTFTVTSASATVGATYTNNGYTFTVLATISGGTTLLCSGTGNPLASGTLTKAIGTGDATITFSAAVAPIVPWYVFTCSSANATVGATFTNNGMTFTVLATIAAGTTLLCSGAASNANNNLTPQASGTLTKASGTGDATITYSAVSYPILVIQLLAGQIYQWLANGYSANPFSADLVTIFFSNSAIANPNINVRALRT